MYGRVSVTWYWAKLAADFATTRCLVRHRHMPHDPGTLTDMVQIFESALFGLRDEQEAKEGFRYRTRNVP